MKINHVTESPNGEALKFQGTLEGPELAFVVETGINVLLKQGAIPFVAKKTHPVASIMMDAPDTEQ